MTTTILFYLILDHRAILTPHIHVHACVCMQQDLLRVSVDCSGLEHAGDTRAIGNLDQCCLLSVANTTLFIQP
jgi:hypothetical protein